MKRQVLQSLPISSEEQKSEVILKQFYPRWKPVDDNHQNQLAGEEAVPSLSMCKRWELDRTNLLFYMSCHATDLQKVQCLQYEKFCNVRAHPKNSWDISGTLNCIYVNKL